MVFMELNGLELIFPEDPNALADLIEGCAAGDLTRDYVKEWYEIHKASIS